MFILIAKRYGYPMKTYKVITEDGYILTLFRIPHNNTDIKKPRQPVLLQHGIVASAIFWILQGQESLGMYHFMIKTINKYAVYQ
ncbi:hypothetical protein NQ314_002809 [Rhamnusium bicolor]|uniref:Partial AB-hydrolase lipase domain-containing protein n=1 Tax=Rhamnusium bicolor TaxID=1586634 RepID=A0AAV8ZRA2_9CUCU|nr:hypothetical protein NQ314_002809 [Rhamnusium bicolor]